MIREYYWHLSDIQWGITHGNGVIEKAPYFLKFIFLLNFPLSGTLLSSTEQTLWQSGRLKIWAGGRLQAHLLVTSQRKHRRAMYSEDIQKVIRQKCYTQLSSAEKRHDFTFCAMQTPNLENQNWKNFDTWYFLQHKYLRSGVWSGRVETIRENNHVRRKSGGRCNVFLNFLYLHWDIIDIQWASHIELDNLINFSTCK